LSTKSTTLTAKLETSSVDITEGPNFLKGKVFWIYWYEVAKTILQVKSLKDLSNGKQSSRRARGPVKSRKRNYKHKWASMRNWNFGVPLSSSYVYKSYRCDSGAASVAYFYWLDSTISAEWVPWDDMGSDTKEGAKIQRASGQLQWMARHSRG